MVTVTINDSTRGGKFLFNLIKGHKSVAVVEKKKSFREAAAECNAISVDEFIGKLRHQVDEHFAKNA